VRHVYAPALRHGLSANQAMVQPARAVQRGFSLAWQALVFFLSAVLHEVIISVPCRLSHFAAFLALLSQARRRRHRPQPTRRRHADPTGDRHQGIHGEVQQATLGQCGWSSL
jgi:hypothetical protein